MVKLVILCYNIIKFGDDFMGTKLNKKVYRTIEEQIDYLIKEKNIDPNTINPNYFSLKTYLSLVTPYTELVCIGRDGTENKRHIYKEKTDFSDFIFWNDVDRCLSLKLQDAVGFFEKNLNYFWKLKYVL